MCKYSQNSPTFKAVNVNHPCPLESPFKLFKNYQCPGPTLTNYIRISEDWHFSFFKAPEVILMFNQSWESLFQNLKINVQIYIQKFFNPSNFIQIQNKKTS